VDFQVTRSLLVGSTSGGRLAAERKILADHFPQFTLAESAAAGVYAVATGKLSTFAGRSYRLRITLPSAYPHALPKINPDGWTPRHNPHVIGGGLCVMRSSQWNSFMSVAFVVAKSALWLNKYEVFLDKGIWPGPEQHFHGPVYNLKKWWHDL